MTATPATADGNILELEDVHTFYGSIEALKGISINVRHGEIVTLTAPESRRRSARSTGSTIRVADAFGSRAATSRTPRRTRSCPGGFRSHRKAVVSFRA
jgi:hypothetical protein